MRLLEKIASFYKKDTQTSSSRANPNKAKSKLSRVLLLGIILFCMVGKLGIQNNLAHFGGGSMIEVARAETTTSNPAPAGWSDPVNTTITTLVELANLFTSLLTFLLTPLIMLAGWLLSPDWTFGDIFGLREIFHKIWILISNMVYVIFAFILVTMAFMNIVWGEWAKAYEIKSQLPKLVISILIVPFTWFIVSATLSVANVLTASVIQLPVAMLQGTTAGKTILSTKMIPKTIVYNQKYNYEAAFSGTDLSKSGIKANGNFVASDCEQKGADCLSLEEFLTNGKGGAYNLLSVYAYGIFKIQEYKQITPKQLEGSVSKLGDILNKLTFGLIFFIIFGILLIAIVYALFSRAMMLWLFAMFSPLFALTHFLEWWKIAKKFSEKIEKHFTIGKFISLAMVPVYVSAALAFGLLFLNTAMNAHSGGGAWDGVLRGDTGIEVSNTDSDTTVMKFGDMTFTTIGLLTSESTSGLNGALSLGKGIIGTIIINVLALVILWMAVMAALSADDITKAAVAPIQSFGESIGKLAVSAPQYIPLKLPGTDKSVSMAGLQSIPSTIQSAMSQKATTEGWKIGQSFAKVLGIEVGELTKSLQLATDKLKWNTAIETQKDIWKDIYGKIGDLKTLDANKSEIIPKFKEMLSVTSVDPATKEKLNKALESGDLKTFIKDFEHYLDPKVGWLSHVDPANTDEYLKSIRQSSAQTIITPLQFKDANKKDAATVDVKIGSIDVKSIDVKIKDGKIDNRGTIGEKLKSWGIKSEEIKWIIDEIESKIPHGD